jgi:hypothetical protein
VCGLSNGTAGAATGEDTAGDLKDPEEVADPEMSGAGDPVVTATLEETAAEDPGEALEAADSPASMGPLGGNC